MPFPALDGGRLIFVLIEWVRGKRINPIFEANLHKLGMLFLLFLFALITIKDIFY
jgi:regulator of sigma E protease